MKQPLLVLFFVLFTNYLFGQKESYSLKSNTIDEHLIKGDSLFKKKNTKEALVQYRRALAISLDDHLDAKNSSFI